MPLLVKMKEQRIKRLISGHILCLLLWLFWGHTLATGQLLNLGVISSSSPCDSECECFSGDSSNGRGSIKKFTVYCNTMKFGLFQGFSVPKNLPWKTTDLVVKDYHLGVVGLNSFDNNPFPLNPRLLTLVLSGCRITFLSRKTFQATSLISLKTFDLTNNHVMLIIEGGTFSDLPSLEFISLSNNSLEDAQQVAFRNLPKVRMINLSHNALSEIHPGTFERVPELEILDLSANRLRNLPWKSISRLTSLQVLRLERNFWNCSCDMTDIININQSLIDGSEAVCLFPEFAKGTLLGRLSSRDFSYCSFDSSSSSPCDSECICFSWDSSNGRGGIKKFTVYCNATKLGLFQGRSVPKNLPWNTTDLVLKFYGLGFVGPDSFDNNPFPLYPRLLTLVLSSCRITFLSGKTFQATSLISLKTFDLTNNEGTLIIEGGTFSDLPSLEFISLLDKRLNGKFWICLRIG